jgi:hypothetical protein
VRSLNPRNKTGPYFRQTALLVTKRSAFPADSPTPHYRLSALGTGRQAFLDGLTITAVVSAAMVEIPAFAPSGKHLVPTQPAAMTGLTIQDPAALSPAAAVRHIKPETKGNPR